MTGRSLVTFFPEENPEFFLKQYPELPGYEFASTLFMRLLGVTKLPYQDLIIFDSKYPVLLTQKVSGRPVLRVWQDPEVFSNLDPFHTGLLIISAMFLNPEDGKEDNFILSQDGRYLIPIDNDHCFLPSFSQNEAKFWNAFTVNTALQTKTILFCLDEMDQPLDLRIKQHIREIDFDKLFISWLTELEKLENRFNNLIDRDKREYFLKQGTVMRIPFYKQFIQNLHWKAHKIQDILKTADEPTPFDLLKAVEPFAARCYNDSFNQGQDLQSRFKAATDKLYTKTVSDGSRVSILNTRSMMEIINISEKDLQKDVMFQKMGPLDSLELLKGLIEEQKKRAKIEQDFICELSDKNKEGILAFIFGNQLLETTLKVKDFLASEKEGLHLQGSKLITSSRLTELFKQAPNKGMKIRFLSLPDSPLLSDKEVRILAEECPNLAYLNVSGCVRLTEIVTEKREWPLLARLEAKKCLNLGKLVSESPIKILRIETNRKITISVEKLTFDTLKISIQNKKFHFSLKKREEIKLKLLEETLLNKNFLLNVIREEEQMKQEIGLIKITAGMDSISSINDFTVFLTVIDLQDSNLKTEDIQIMIKLKLINLKRLDLSQNNLQGTDYLEHLIQAKWPKLSHLNLSDNEVHDEGLEILCQSNWPELEFLNLDSTSMTKKGLLKLFFSMKWPKFRSLRLPKDWEKTGVTLVEAFIQKDLSLMRKSGENDLRLKLAQLDKILKKYKSSQRNIQNNSNKDIPFEEAFLFVFEECPLLEEFYIESLKMTTKGLETIINQSKWQQLKHLYLSNNEIFDEGISILTRTEWPLIEKLDVKNTKITSQGIEILVNKMHLPNLKRLDISENLIEDQGIKILTSGKWPLLEHLIYYNTQVTTKGNMSLLENMKWPNLSHLEHSLNESFYNFDERENQWNPSKIILVTVPMWYKEESILVTVLSMNWLNSKEIYLSINHQDVDVKVIILPYNKLDQLETINISFNALPKIRSLQTIILPFHGKNLDLSNNSLSDQSQLENLFKEKCPQFESLCSSRTALTSKSIEVLAKKFDWSKLKKLEISRNTIQNEGLEILSSIKWHLLEDLNLTNMQIDVKGIDILVSKSDWSNLKKLDISHNPIENKGLEILSSKRLPLLEDLNLARIKINAEGIKNFVSQSDWRPNLKKLDLSWNSIQNEGFETLCYEEWPQLEDLRLKSNGLTKKGFETGFTLSEWPNLKKLDLSYNKNLFERDIKGFAFEEWPLLEYLDLRWTNLALKDAKALIRRLNLEEIYFEDESKPDEVIPMKALILERLSE